MGDLANTIWALATMGHNPGERFMIPFIESAKEMLPCFNSQDFGQYYLGSGQDGSQSRREIYDPIYRKGQGDVAMLQLPGLGQYYLGSGHDGSQSRREIYDPIYRKGQ